MSAGAYRKLYAQIPSFQCVEGCTDCCGPIPFSAWEWKHLSDKRPLETTSCPYSETGKCEIYEDRPFMCRLFGTTPKLACPHGKAPMKMLTEAEASALTTRYAALGPVGVPNL